MKLRTLPANANVEGKRILLRVDWNVPLDNRIEPDEALKIERTLGTVASLAGRGAVVVLLTHLGRPKGRDNTYSTERLLPSLKSIFHFSPRFHTASVSSSKECALLCRALDEARPGSIHLLENVRFDGGEEKNDPKLAKAYAELGDLFMNDAFASSHRDHVTVSGLAKVLPSYAGPELVEEVAHLSPLLHKPKKPFVALIGGLKLSTKIPVLKALVNVCDRVMVGGAMATTFAAAKGWPTGKSFVEKEALPLAKQLLKKKELVLPEEVVVADAIEKKAKHRVVALTKIGPEDIVVDIAPRTLKAWAEECKKAKTILWNGPMGVMEVPAFGAGSRFIARAIAACAKGSVYTVAGGGDTLPIVFSTKNETRFTYVSTGGGALLEFLALGGKLPGLLPLESSKT